LTSKSTNDKLYLRLWRRQTADLKNYGLQKFQLFNLTLADKSVKTQSSLINLEKKLPVTWVWQKTGGRIY